MKTSKRLWEYKNWTLFECEPFHHVPSSYKSWKEFAKDKKALTCNCVYNSPLLYWYWDNGEAPEDGSEDSYYDDFPHGDYGKIDFKRVIFVYRSWFSGIAKFVVCVSWEDEPKIRKFIKKAQKNQIV